MRAPRNRRVFVIGYGAATPLGRTFAETWERAVRGDAGFFKPLRASLSSLACKRRRFIARCRRSRACLLSAIVSAICRSTLLHRCGCQL